MKTINKFSTMKPCNIYKKGLFVFAVLLITFISNGQDREKSVLKFKSWSVTPIEVYDFSNKNQNLFSGFLPTSISTDIAFALNENLFSISGTLGGETGIFGGSASYKQISLLYGREYELKKWLFADAHIGSGMFFYSSTEFNKNISEFAIPLVGKLRFKTDEKFSIGLRLSYIF
ncbi:hypothetical protein MWU50_13595 [Flavobacteriaceae bacterium S0862]|nr:hypothetical protein [Flavobacteriaceae bacterium S0862]